MLFYYSDTGGPIQGRVVKIESKDYYVRKDDGTTVRCNLRGKFKKSYNLKKDKLFALDVAIVGDHVDIDINEDGTGTITSIDKRSNYLSRKAPRIKGASYRGERLEQVIAANIDHLFIISSVDFPAFNNRVIDRIIVAGESSHVDTSIVINKMDLNSDGFIEQWIDLYKSIGYKVFSTCVKTGEGLDELKTEMDGNINLLWGQSGVGKSSLVNSLYGFDLNTGEISDFSSKGTHTTVTSLMLNVGENTFVIDTPGVREIDPYGIKKEDLGHYFLEFGQYLENCRFNTCTHHHEPGCAVIEAVESGYITPERYESYLRLLDTIEADMIF